MEFFWQAALPKIRPDLESDYLARESQLRSVDDQMTRGPHSRAGDFNGWLIGS